MILNPQLIQQEIKEETITFKYPLSFNGENRFAVIVVNGVYPNRNVKVLLTDELGNEIESNEFMSEEGGQEIKESWQKFEDYFNESDEGKTEEPQDEIENLYTSFDLSGNAVLFFQNLKGEQRVIMSYEILDTQLLNTRPQIYELNFENNLNFPEPLRTKWLIANVSDSVSCSEFLSYPFTYQVAITSIQPPDNPQPPENDDNMPFFRLIRVVSNIVTLKEYVLNRKTNNELFVKDEMFRILNNSEPYKVMTPEGEGTLVPYPKLNSGTFKAYIIAIKGENPPPPDNPTPPDDDEPNHDDEPIDDHDDPIHYVEPPIHLKNKGEPVKIDYSELTEKVADFLNKEPLQISRSMRSADSVRDLLEIYNVKIAEIGAFLGLPQDNKGFFQEIKKIIGK